ncbi:MAG: ABC transporter permease [Synechococcales cyanobacterium]
MTDASRPVLSHTVFWRIAEGIPARLTWILNACSVLIPFALWWVISSSGWVDHRFLPTPVMVWGSLVRLWTEGILLKDATTSFVRVMSGFLLAAIIATPIGIAMGTFASIRALFEPIVAILRYMPAPAFTPLLILYFGLDEEPKIMLIFIGTLFFNVLMIMDGVKFTPKELIEVTYTLGGLRWQVLLQVITPYILPNILDTYRVNIATSWNLVVVSELIAANEGLGKRIQLAQRFFRTDDIFACLIVLGLIGFFLDLAMRTILRQTCRWAFGKS